MAGGSARPSESARRRRSETLRDVRRGLIVEAAKSVFGAEGLQGTSMRLIAAEAGCTTGAIYPHFRSKEQLYAAVLSQSLTALRDSVAARASEKSRPRKAARAGLLAFFDYYRVHPDELSLGLYLYRGIRPAGLDAELDQALNRQLRDVFDLIEARFADAGAEDPRARTATAIAQAVGLLILEQTGRLRLFGKDARDLFADFLRGA